MARSPVTYWMRNCTPMSASAPVMSQHERLYTASRLTRRGISRTSAEHISTITTTTENCISFISSTYLFVCRVNNNNPSSSYPTGRIG